MSSESHEGGWGRHFGHIGGGIYAYPICAENRVRAVADELLAVVGERGSTTEGREARKKM